LARHDQARLLSLDALTDPLSRRTVPKRAAALGVSAPIVAVFGSAPAEVVAQAPGVPVIVLDSEPNNLNPLISESRVTFTVLDNGPRTAIFS
jgi:hypothetical protein